MALKDGSRKYVATLAICAVIGCTSAASAQTLVPSDGAFMVAQAGPGEWHGYRGAEGPRHGYRRGPDGWWYPLAAFMVGVTAGAMVAQPHNDMPPPLENAPPPRRVYVDPREELSPEHYAWCAKRYRSYQVSDNSYVPRAGLRAECVSPYSG